MKNKVLFTSLLISTLLGLIFLATELLDSESDSRWSYSEYFEEEMPLITPQSKFNKFKGSSNRNGGSEYKGFLPNSSKKTARYRKINNKKHTPVNSGVKYSRSRSTINNNVSGGVQLYAGGASRRTKSSGVGSATGISNFGHSFYRAPGGGLGRDGVDPGGDPNTPDDDPLTDPSDDPDEDDPLIDPSGDPDEDDPFIDPGGDPDEDDPFIDPGGDPKEDDPFIDPGGDPKEDDPFIDPGGDPKEDDPFIDPGGDPIPIGNSSWILLLLVFVYFSFKYKK